MNVFFWTLLFAPPLLRAQAPQQVSPAVAAQIIMQPQPPVDRSQPEIISATAEFDPPALPPGGKTLYRVGINATENSIDWPDKIAAPPALRPGSEARGQLTQLDGTPFHPLTEFVYEFTAPVAGHFVISNFAVMAGGRRVEIPPASVDVAASAAPAPPRKIWIEASETNLFFGQPFRLRVILPVNLGNQIETLRDVQFNGGGLLTDKFATSSRIETINRNGQPKPAFIYETVATPLVAGRLAVSAQAFTAGNQFNNSPITTPVVIPGGSPNIVLLVSDGLNLNVRPLPSESELPGFTGAIGKFIHDPPHLSTNRLRVGEPAHLKVVFHAEGDLTRLAPPDPPRSSDWQIIPDNPPDIGYTLIPLTDEARETPAIPFSSFDPATATYVDLTIPPLPVTVVGESLPVQLPVSDVGTESAAPLKLSGLATTPGKTMSSLQPLQLRGWFACLLPLPLMGFFALWQWDRRRRFLEAHPEIIRRRQARRALRRERCALEKAASAGDAAAFVHHAADAMKISCAPHFPAHPRALVCADVLAQLDDADKTGRAAETVKAIFGAADTQYSGTGVPPVRTEMPMERTGGTPVPLLTLAADVDAVLQKLEEKL